MTVELLIVYFLYPIVGLCTIAVLDKYKMRLAKILYTVAFFMMFMYLPFCVGDVLIEDISPFSFMSREMIVALTQSLKFNVFRNLAPEASYAFLIAIAVSAFICISAIAVALTTAIRVVRHLCRRCPKLVFAHTHIEKTVRSRRAFPSVNLCHTLCRYNC